MAQGKYFWSVASTDGKHKQTGKLLFSDAEDARLALMGKLQDKRCRTAVGLIYYRTKTGGRGPRRYWLMVTRKGQLVLSMAYRNIGQARQRAYK